MLITQECVERVRKIGLRLVHDQGQIDLGAFELSFGPTPRRVDIPVGLPAVGPTALREGNLVLALNPGHQVRAQAALHRPLPAQNSGLARGVHALAAVVASRRGPAAVRAHRSPLAISALPRRRRHRPLVVKTVGGQALSLNREASATIGGSGATLALPDVLAGQVLAHMRCGTATRRACFSLTAEPGVRMAIDGVNVVGVARYAPGRLLRFLTATGASPQEVTLLKGRAQDVEFGGDLGSTGLGSTGLGSGFGTGRFGLASSLSGGDAPAGGLRI